MNKEAIEYWKRQLESQKAMLQDDFFISEREEIRKNIEEMEEIIKELEEEEM